MSREQSLELILEQPFHVSLLWKENNLKLLKMRKVQEQHLHMLHSQKVCEIIDCFSESFCTNMDNYITYVLSRWRTVNWNAS
jgi:hypothetical protein